LGLNGTLFCVFERDVEVKNFIFMSKLKISLVEKCIIKQSWEIEKTIKTKAHEKAQLNITQQTQTTKQ